MPKRNERIEIAGRSYRVVKNIGNGGSGSVWLVDCEGEGYALKLIVSDNSGKIARFQKEIDFCSEARHRNIVRVLASGWYNSQPVYLMRCYAHTFREVIENEKDAAKLIGYILEICRGIKYIHAKGVIHRDIKPENILIEGEVAVLADFGIAHFKGLGITRHDELLANRNYMAPEQKIKNNARNIDKSVDVYALGVMINECFTKQNLGGSWYRLIADSYPILAALDNLVSSMIRQNPQERPAIAAVETELKFIYGKYKRGFLEMQENLQEQVYPTSLSRSLVNTIIRRASEDILMGRQLFLTSSADEFRQYNGNWHMRVGYCVDDFLLNLYIQEQIFGYCKSKFNYESNVYRKNNWYQALDMDNKPVDMALYQRMAQILEKYRLLNPGEKLLDLSGKILKYFAACADYHCEEILSSIDDVEDRARTNLLDAPILWIVGWLKWGISERMEQLISGIDGLGGKYDFRFEDHISINWNRAESFKETRDDEDFYDQEHLKTSKKEQEVLIALQKKWNVTCTAVDRDWYSIKFNNYPQYQKFKKYALELSKPYYVFEGDVLDIFASPDFVGSMVEIWVSRVFAIPHTLAKLTGLRKLDD